MFKKKSKLEKILDEAQISKELQSVIIPALKQDKGLRKNIKKILKGGGIAILSGLKIFYKKNSNKECEITLKEVLEEYENL